MKVSIGPYKDDEEREVSIQIDNYDTWSMDYTLALIILPMLQQLKKTKNGSPSVEDEDVPEELRSTSDIDYDPANLSKSGETDKFWEARWDYILDEMIWAFEQILDNQAEAQFYSGEADFFWIPAEKINGEQMWELRDGPNNTFKGDTEKLREWRERKQQGFNLFGKYYEDLWD